MKVAAALSILFAFARALAALPDGAAGRDEFPLQNWLPAPGQPAPARAGASESVIEAMALPSSASHFIALTPCRVVDTRRPDGPHGGPMLSAAVDRAFNIPAGPCAGIPPASAYSLNIAVTGSASGSSQFLTTWPAGTTRPLVATLTFDGGGTTSSAAIVPADAIGAIAVYASTNTHLIVDINGYIKEGVVTSVTPGPGLAGGGTGAVSLGIPAGVVGANELGASAVTTGAIADAAVTGAKIGNGEVVRSVKGLGDAITIVGDGGTSVTAAGSTITVTGSGAGFPSGGAILAPRGDTTLISAGFTEVGEVDEVIWRPTSTDGAPEDRTYHIAVWTGTKMIVWGGYVGLVFAETGAQYDPLSDTWVPTSNLSAPSSRIGHTAVWTGTRMIIWGGMGLYPGATDTGGEYDPVADSWTPTATAGAPSPRFDHTAIWTGTEMLIWGGQSSISGLNTGGRYDPALHLWTAIPSTGSPSLRRAHSAVWAGSRMIVWGGYANTTGSYTYLDTGGRYDPISNTWSPTSTTGAPSPRELHSAVWTGNRMIVWGGYSGGLLGSGGQYDPDTDSWTSTSATNAPAARYRHTAVWTGDRIMIWGGYLNLSGESTQTGAEYDPIADAWSSTTMFGAPSARALHTAIWSGHAMIICGGSSGNTGSRWTPLSLWVKN